MMSKAKQKSKKSKEASAKREDETSFMEDSADTSLKTGHSRSPGATGGKGSIETSEVSGPDEEDQVKKKPGALKRIRKSISKATSRSSKSSSKQSVQSPTSPTSLGDDSLRQSEETEEVSEREPLGTDISVRKPSTISSCDSQASGGPVSPSTEQMRSHEERIRELEQKLQNTEGMSSKRFEEELQRKKQEVSTELQKKELEDKLQELQEKVESLQQQQQQTEMEMAERDRKHKVEIEQKKKQYELQLDSKQKQVRAALQKQLRDKEEMINTKDEEINDKEEEIKKLREQLAQKEVAQQQVRSSQAKVVQNQESELKKLKEELTEKEEEVKMKLRDKETQVLRFVQRAEKQLQESQTQLQQEQERHAQEKKQMIENYETQLQEATQQLETEKKLQMKLREREIQAQQFSQKVEEQHQTQLLEEKERHAQEIQQMVDNYEAQLQEATQQHEVEKNRLLSESQLLEQEQKRALEEMADKVRQYEEQQQDIPQQRVQGTDQVTKDHEVQMEQLKQQHKRALEEKDKQLTECRSRLQEETQRYEKDMMKRMREFQAKLSDADRRHKAQLDDRQKQYDLSLAETHKRGHDALQLQVAQVKRSHEKELKQKEEENTHEMEQEIQQREQMLRQEFQKREQVLQQELQQKDQVLQQELQQREQRLRQQDTQLRRCEQEVIEKDAKIAQLESDLSGMIPSSEPPSEENVPDLHSNVVDLAREISRYVDPENVLPSVRCCHHLTPPEVQRIAAVLGGQEQLQEHKPQNYCFAILPADNQMQSVLFDYTGTFRPRPDDQVCPLRAQEEDRFQTPPSTPPSEVPQMIPQDADASDVAANLPDSEKIKRLQKALNGHIQLHADMEEKMKSKTDEVEHWQNKIVDLQREMEAKDEELRGQGEEIQVLRQRVKEKEQEIEEKLQSIEDFHKKVEQRDRQLDILKKPSNEVELSPKALEECDKYFDHVLKLTEELTDSEATVKKQLQELEKLRKLVERAERMEEQVTRGTVELSEKEQEIKELSKHVQKLQHTVGSGGVELEDEVDRLRQFEQEVKELKTQLEEAQDELHKQGMVCHQLKLQHEETLQLKSELEEHMKVKKMKLEDTLDELEKLKERNGKLEMQLQQREQSLMKSQGASEEALQVKREPSDLKMADRVKVLQEKLQARDEELELLRQQATGSGVPLQASLKYEDLPPDTDPRVEIAMLKQALESEEQKVESLQVQVHSFEGVIKHTKEQSKQVVKLKKELTALKVEKEVSKGETMPSEERREDQTGTDLVSQLEELKEKLAKAEDEKLKVKQEREHYKTEVEQLRGDLEVTHNESAKEGKNKSEKGEALALRLQLAAHKSEQDQLHHQLEQTEATVRQLETGLNLSKARVAELEGEITKLEDGMTKMQTSLSESEHHRQGLFQELSKVKKQRDTLDQKCISLLALNEDLKSQASQVDCVLDEIAQVRREASKWKEILSSKSAEVVALKKENDDLKQEIAARKAEAVLWKEDFQRERHDREQAAGRIDDERAQLHIQNQQVQDDLQARIHQLEFENKRLQDEIGVFQGEMKGYQQVMTNFNAMQQQLVQHKDKMANMEQLFQAQQREYKAQLDQSNQLQRTQLEDVHRRLRQANQQLDQAVTDNEKLNDDVLAKTQQVKQYKKQVDGLKAELTKYKSQRPATKEELDMQTAILESKQTEAVRQLEEVTRKFEEARKISEELRKERDALCSEVEQLKSGKLNERHFSAAFQKEFEKRGEVQEKYQKEFEMRGEFETKYHQYLDRCTELSEEVLQLRGILEQHKIKIPDPPPKQRAPPADIPRHMTQQPQALMARSSEGALHPPRYHGDPAAHHTSPPLVRSDPPHTNVPPEVHPHPPLQYEFHQLPTPIQPIPQQGGGEIYEPHAQAWVQSQPYNPGEQPSDMVYHAQGQARGHAPQPVRDQPHHEAHYDEGMRRENEAINKDLAVKVQMQQEDENIKALMAQQNAACHQEQDHQFHQEHEMAHQHQGHFRQGYSVDDPRYAPVQHQDEVGPSGHSSLPTSSITAPQLGEGRPHHHPQVHPSHPHVPGIMQYGDLAVPHRMHGPQHPGGVDPYQQQFEKIHYQRQIEEQQMLQAQEQIQAQQQMARMEAQNAHGENTMQQVHGNHQGHQGYPQMEGIPQVQPGMAQHLLGAYHAQHPTATPRLYGDSPLPQSHPRHPLPAHNVSQPPVSPHPLPPGRDRPGQYPVGLQPAVPPHHLPPGSEQACIPDQYEMGMQPTVTPNAGQPPQEQYPQGEPITPTEEANRDHAAKISKPIEESCPDLPKQRQKQASVQQDENRLMKGLDTEIHDTAADVEANVQSKEEESLRDAPMDPNLVCPMCGHGYRVGEIQRYRRHVKSCHGSKQ